MVVPYVKRRSPYASLLDGAETEGRVDTSHFNSPLLPLVVVPSISVAEIRYGRLNANWHGTLRSRYTALAKGRRLLNGLGQKWTLEHRQSLEERSEDVVLWVVREKEEVAITIRVPPKEESTSFSFLPLPS